MLSRRKTIILIAISTILALLLVSAWWWAGSPRKPAVISPGDYSYTIKHAEDRIPKMMNQKHLPSLAVALVDDQDTIWQETFGLANLEKKHPTQADTIYKLWSVAKLFTAIETHRLVEDGLVELDAPLTDYIPGFVIQSRYPDPGQITIRSILTHRSGLPRNGCRWIKLNPNLLADLVASLEDCHQVVPVGYRYKYSNAGFDLLGYLIEEMRGVPFPDYLRDELLFPIGMKNSTFLRLYLPAGLEVAPGYEFSKGEYYPYEQGDITSVPSGNLYATIEDMGQFVKFIFRHGEVNGEHLIAPETLERMFVEQVSSTRDPQSMGLGWKTSHVLGNELLVWHDGGPSEGTGALVAFLPGRKLGVVLIANGNTFDGSVSVPLALEFLELMLETKYDLRPAPEARQPTVEIERSILENYVGKYIAFGEVMEVYIQGDQLKGSIQGFSFNLEPLSDTLFQPRNWLADIGLASLLGAPFDLRQLKVEFMAGDEISADYMILHLGGIGVEICPEYPWISEIPPLWQKLAGDYELVARLPSGMPGTEGIGQSSIWMEDGVLQMGGDVGPILPISETGIIIQSGPFSGETMVYEPRTGNIYHQRVVYLKR